MPKFSQLFWPAISSAIVTLVVLGIAQRSNFNSSNEPEQRDLSRTAIPVMNQQRLVDTTVRPAISMTGAGAVAQHSATSENVVNQAVQNETPHVSAAERLQMQQQMVAAHDQRIAIHNSEVRNFNWASKMENQIQDAFRALPTNAKAHLERTDCRSQTCTVVISWPSRDDAQQELQLPSIAVAQIPCNDGIVLPPSTPGEDRFQAILLLDCASHEMAARN